MQDQLDKNMHTNDACWARGAQHGKSSQGRCCEIAVPQIEGAEEDIGGGWKPHVKTHKKIHFVAATTITYGNGETMHF